MEQISMLVETTPQVFYKVNAFVKILGDHLRAAHLQCRVDPTCRNQEEIDDMFQAFIDICCVEIANGNLDTAELDLEYPVRHHIELVWDVNTNVELRRSSKSKSIVVKKRYFDAPRNLWQAYTYQHSY